ncbi:hypothetical protein C8R46DRAFT_1351892, partial [Mycena filopes]
MSEKIAVSILPAGSPKSHGRHAHRWRERLLRPQTRRDLYRKHGIVCPQQRVMMAFEQGALTLHMRFSGLEMPSSASVKICLVSSSCFSTACSSRYAP